MEVMKFWSAQAVAVQRWSRGDEGFYRVTKGRRRQSYRRTDDCLLRGGFPSEKELNLQVASDRRGWRPLSCSIGWLRRIYFLDEDHGWSEVPSNFLVRGYIQRLLQ